MRRVGDDPSINFGPQREISKHVLSKPRPLTALLCMSIPALLFRLTIVGIFVAGLFGLPVTPAVQAQTTEICLGRIITRLDFRNPVRISGSNLAVGSVYRFSNVSTGIDALVRIDALNNGATLTTIDNDTGLVRNFQPELAGSNARSADFTISFVTAGTSTPLVFDFVGTAIDVDGDSASLREYAEFQNTYAEYLLNNPTRLDVNASTPTPGNTRFESRTNFTAPGIDPNANENIVAAFYSAESSIRYRIGALGTGSTTRLTSLDFTCPNLPAPAPIPAGPQDFTDAPAAYGNPIHDIITGIRMGPTNTAETAPYNSPNATGDAGDDGITISNLIQSQNGTATVAVVGANGRLSAWFDWNGDGDFNDAGEQVATDVRDNQAGDANAATGTIGLSFAVPANAVVTQTFARFRWSTQAGLPPSSITARDGEVSDYAITIRGLAVLSTTKTNSVYGPASSFGLFHIPGNDVLYSITTRNTGSGPADANSLFVVDTLPSQVTFFNGDVDGAGPATGAVYFTQSSGAGLTFTLATDLRYSNAVGVPANFAACTFTPAAGYDTSVRHVCLNPKGTFASGNPNPNFTVTFRARIR